MAEPLANSTVTFVLIGHHVRTWLYVGVQFGAQCLGSRIRHHLSAHLATTLHDAHDDYLVRAALAARCLFVGVLVLLTANKGFVALNHAIQRLVERLRASRVPEPVEDEPSRLLSDLQVLGELRRSD